MTDEKILELYLSKMSVNDIVNKDKQLTSSHVYYVLKKNNVKIRNKNDMSSEIKRDVIRDSKTMSTYQLSLKYNIDRTFLVKFLNSIEVTESRKKLILLLKDRGLKPYDISIRLSMRVEVIHNVFKEHNVCEKILFKVGLTKEDIKEIRLKILKDKGVK